MMTEDLDAKRARKLDQWFVRIAEEVRWQATKDHANEGSIHSLHEGFAILLEEIEEFKHEVWKKKADRDELAMRRELVQISAVCMNILRNCICYID